MAEDQSQLVQRAGGVQAHDRLALERWINEGGHIATDAVIEREMAAGKAHLVEPRGNREPVETTLGHDISPARITERPLARSQP